jgi:putative FmdB family regulatory protein
VRGYHRFVPIYEFVCDSCGERFEDLVAAGTETIVCQICGKGPGRRILSKPAPTPHLVKTPREARKQERSNAALQARSKKAFGDAVRAARPKQPPPGPSGGR